MPMFMMSLKSLLGLEKGLTSIDLGWFFWEKEGKMKYHWTK
jgi:hypothetical protein